MATTPTRRKTTVAAGQTSSITFPAAGGTFVGWEITGNAKPITITATTGSNIMTPGNAVQNLVTGASNDTLKGNGKSSLQGGAGNDAYIITKAGDTIIEAVGAGNDTVQSSITGTAGYSLAANVENLTLTGSALAGQGNTLDNVITGNSGKNTLTGGGGADTINAGSGNDLIIAGSAGLNLMNINGGSGIDTLQIDAASGQLYAVNLDSISNVEYFKVGSNVYSPDRFAGIVENQQTLSTSNANLSTANASAAVALSTANASNAAALSTANADAAVALSTAIASNAAALSTANSNNAVALSTTNGQLSTANSTISVLSTSTASNAAQELQNAVNNLALVPNATSISVLGGAAANTYYSLGGVVSASYVSSGPSATLTGNNFLDLPTTINGTNSGNWYMIGGPAADVFLGNSSANTFIGNSGADTFTSGGGADYIDGGLGADTFNFASADLTSSVTLSGGSQADTIVFTAAATVADSAFTNVSSVESITGTVGLNISVGSLAQAAGITTVTGGTTSDSFTDALTTGTTPFNFVGGNGADTFSFANSTRFAADYVTGGTGLDQIVITTDGQSLADAAFARIAAGTIESLSLSGGANSVVFGTTANAAGFTSSVTTGSGDDYISVASGFTSTTTFNSGAGNDTFVLGSTSGVSLNGGLGDDTFSAAGLTGANVFTSYINGSAGTNVLAFGTGGALIENIGFTNAANIQSITSVGAINATLGTTAAAAGLVSVSGSTGADTFSYSGSQAITFTGGSGADSFTVTGGTAASTFLGGDGNDTFTFASNAQLVAASVDGGAGVNGVVFSSGVTSTDADFSRIAAGTVEALTISSSASSLLVGSNALAAGIRTITGGTAADTIIANYGTTAVTLSGGGGADTLGGSDAAATNSSNVTFAFTGMSNYTGSSLFASSAGTNVLSFANSVVFEGVNFTSSSNVQTLQLNGTAGSVVTVDSAGATVGFTTISAAGATTGSTFAIGNFSNAISFVGSSGNDTFVYGGSGFTAASSINAGAGTDTIRYDGAAVADSIFQKITAGTAEVLSATSSDTITVGSNALNAGITTVNGGTGNTTFNVASSFGTSGISIVAGTSDDTFNFVSGTGFSNSTINGGVGADSVVFTTGVTITSIANISNVETIYLNGSSSSTLTIGNGGVFGTNTLTISGTAAANSIDASSRTSGAINYLGSNSADSFTGGGSNDTLQGWATANSSTIDTLTGGNGADVFVIATGYDGTAIGTLGYGVSGTNSGYAIITDFGLNDKISLGGIDATTGGGATAGGIVVSALGSTGFSIQLSGVEIARATYAGGATAAQFI